MTTFEIKLHQYLEQRLTKYEVFWLGSDAVVLMTVEEFTEKWELIQKDLQNFFAFKIVVVCCRPTHFKTRIGIVAENYYSAYQISINQFKEIQEQYGRFTDQDDNYYH
jgi:hypothetical protein